MIYRSVLCLALGTVLLTACGSDAPPEETEAEAGRNAKGEVVGGTISDAMIPLDQLRSQSPPMPTATSRPTATASPGDEAPEEAEDAEAVTDPLVPEPAEDAGED